MHLVVIQVLFLLLFPALILFGVRKWRKLEVLSPILLAYISGTILANLQFFQVNNSLSMSIAEFSVPLAIPLVLFSTDFIRWLRLAKTTILSFCLVMVSVMASAMIASRFFAGRVDEAGKIAAMLTGVYTGGTPNLMAIGLALKVREETVILVNTADVILGGLYLVFLMLFARRILSKFMPAFKLAADAASHVSLTAAAQETRLGAKEVAVVLGLALLAVLASVGLSFLIYGDLVAQLVILTVTTLGVAASFHRKVRQARGSYETGHYMLLVFSAAIGTTVNFTDMVRASPTIFIYTAVVMTGAVVLHFILAALFRIDVDTAIITSTAGIYGPAFIAPIAGVLKNREVLVSGLTTALVGYAVGNYLGLAVAWLLAL